MNKEQINSFIFPDKVNWEYLKRFIICGSCKSFKEALAIIETGGAALAKQMDSVEEALGVELFERVNSNRTTQLTEQGHIYYNFLKNTFIELENIHYKLKNTQKKEKEINLVTTPGLLEHIFPTFITEYARISPDVHINTSAETHTREIKDNEIMIRGNIPEQENLIKKLLFSHEFTLFASKEYVERYGEPEILSDIINHHYLSLEERLTTTMNRGNIFLKKMGLKPNVSSNSFNLLLSLCKNGVGIFEIPDMLGSKEGLVKVLAGEPSPKINIYICYKRHIANEPQVINFLNMVHSFFK